ncbi:MAG: hypothetical protein PVI79_09560 [Gammaproteobacteria bacterium]|jgi:hypothetical protein
MGAQTSSTLTITFCSVMNSCCTDQNGNPKNKYQSKEEAEKVAERRRDEGVAIKTYQCEKGDGWHLTSKNAPLPTRPEKVMTQEERGLYTRPEKCLPGDSVGEEIFRQIKKDVLESTLRSWERKIDQIQQEIDEKVELIRCRRKQIAELKKELLTAEEDLKATRRNLSVTKREYESAKSLRK